MARNILTTSMRAGCTWIKKFKQKEREVIYDKREAYDKKKTNKDLNKLGRQEYAITM